MKRTLPTDSAERKNYPLMRGCLRYFPAALAGVARISKLGNDKHNPGEELHHARGKSMDHGDCILRHLHDAEELIAAFNRGPEIIDLKALMEEVDQLAWRALAYAQEIHEKYGNAPLAMGARLPEVKASYVPGPAVIYKAGGAAQIDTDGGALPHRPLNGHRD